MTSRTGLKSLDIKKIREQQGMNKKMPKQVRIKIIVDLLMTVLLMLLMAFELIGREEHEWLGVGMFAAFVVHHILNRKWTAHLLKGKYPPFRIAQTALAFLVLICMISSMVSGIVMSRYVFDFLPIQGGWGWARTLHMLAAYWGFVLMSLHLGLHWNMMMGMAGRAAAAPSLRRDWLLRAIGILIAGYGVFAFFRRQIGAYMLLQIAFAFFDFEEPLILFFADYLAVMGLFVWIGHYLARALRAAGKSTDRKKQTHG